MEEQQTNEESTQALDGEKKEQKSEFQKKQERLHTVAWYALFVQFQHERKIRDAINKQGATLLARKTLNYAIEAWVPVTKEKHLWSDRSQMVDVVQSPGIVFVRLKQSDKQHIYIDRHIKSFMFDRTIHEAVRIPDNQMNAFFSDFAKERDLEITIATPTVGKKAKIVVGPLAGYVGLLVERNGSHRFQIKVAELACSIEVKEDEIIGVDADEQSERVENYSRVRAPRPKAKTTVTVSRTTRDQFEAKPYQAENARLHRQLKKQKEEREK